MWLFARTLCDTLLVSEVLRQYVFLPNEERRRVFNRAERAMLRPERDTPCKLRTEAKLALQLGVGEARSYHSLQILTFAENINKSWLNNMFNGNRCVSEKFER